MYKLKLPSLKSLWNPVETQLYNSWKYNRIQLKKMAVPMPYILAAKYVTKFNRYTGANMTRNLAETGADNSISSIYMRRFKPNLVYFIARILAFSCLNSQWLWPVLCETPGLRKKKLLKAKYNLHTHTCFILRRQHSSEWSDWLPPSWMSQIVTWSIYRPVSGIRITCDLCRCQPAYIFRLCK